MVMDQSGSCDILLGQILSRKKRILKQKQKESQDVFNYSNITFTNALLVMTEHKKTNIINQYWPIQKKGWTNL